MPQNPSPKKGQNGLCPFHMSHRKPALEISQFLRRNFWMISEGPFSPGPFVLLLTKSEESEQIGVTPFCRPQIGGSDLF